MVGCIAIPIPKKILIPDPKLLIPLYLCTHDEKKERYSGN